MSNFEPNNKINEIKSKGGNLNNESLKFQLMAKESNSWSQERIENHQKHMQDLLTNFLQENRCVIQI